jgi:hypothetical protein
MPGWIGGLFEELWSLFVDDGVLALAVLLWVSAVALAHRLLGLGSPVACLLLFLGPAGLLAESVWRRSRRP